MSKAMQFKLWRYGVAVIAVALALLLKLLLEPLIEAESPFVIFLGAVMFSAYYGGIGAGILATALSAVLSNYFFLEPTFSLLKTDLGQNLRLGLFVLESLLISKLISALHSAKRQAEGSKLESQQHLETVRQSQQALHESYSILHAVIEGTTDAIFMKDLQGRYVILNSAAAKVLGKPVEEIVGKDDTETLPPDIASQIMETDRRILTSEVAEVCEEIVPMMDEIRTFFSAKTVCRDEQGKVIGIIGVARDISDRKLAEQKIKQLNQDLERRVIERTAQLEATNQELEAFSYSVSHDLRAPLRSIDGFSLALLERYAEQLDDKGKHYLQRVRAATGRMGQLIDDLLNLSRVTRSQMQHQQVDLTTIVKEIAVHLQQTQPERTNVEFVIAEEVVAEGDSRLLLVVLENLLSNAWKFTSKQIHPRIEFGSTSEKNAKKIYFVRDNGAGFDMAYIDKLFGAFQRLHSIDEFPGNGIGLATVQRIIYKHGGQIWAEGAAEQGATFYFTLEHH